jgi:HSP20 family protein
MADKKNNNWLIAVVVVLALLVAGEGLFLWSLYQKNNEMAALVKQQSQRTINDAKKIFGSPLLSQNKNIRPFARSGFFQRDPFQELQRMHDELDRLMAGVFQNSMIPPRPNAALPSVSTMMMAIPTFAPDADYEETANNIILKFDMPGMEKDKIKVRVEDGILTVEGERKSEQKAGDESAGFYSSEIQYGSYSRSMSLPPTVDGDKVQANYDKGVLTVTIPKKKGVTSEPKTVPIV